MITAADVKKFVDEHRDEAILLLQEGLQAPCVTGNETPMAQVVERWIKKAGSGPKCYEKAEGRPNVLVEWKGSK